MRDVPHIEVKECCQWWSALVECVCATGRAASWVIEKQDKWLQAAKRLYSSTRRTRATERPHTLCGSWRLAARRMAKDARNQLSNANRNSWERVISSLYRNSAREIKAKPYQMEYVLCPSCKPSRVSRAMPAWIVRCLATARQRQESAEQSPWHRKVASIASGNSRRLSSLRRDASKRTPPPSWEQAVRIASKAKAWSQLDEWSKWSVNVCSNLRKRERWKNERTSIAKGIAQTA